jgi:alkylation response protein AidB-like acyl-CoA dehydrogenase
MEPEEAMNFEFSPEQVQLRETARRYLREKCTTSVIRDVLESERSSDLALWQGLADLGFLAIAIPEKYGGLGLGYLELCVVAEELGRALAPVPFSSSIFLASEFLLVAGSETQKLAWLPHRRTRPGRLRRRKSASGYQAELADNR